MLSLIRIEYADLISMTRSRSPNNYEVIDFQKFLSRKLHTQINFISKDTIIILRDKILAKYNSDKTCFEEFGDLCEMSFSDLKYYQYEVGISGPKYSNAEEPVSILEVNGEYILWNGYHRALLKILNNDKTIKGYVLTTSN